VTISNNDICFSALKQINPRIRSWDNALICELSFRKSLVASVSLKGKELTLYNLAGLEFDN
jgi:hypothetical protein